MKKILFICTHNRCRSILAEAVTNHIGDGVLEARSAGSSPAGEVHPKSLHFLEEAGISTEGLTSQSWDDHEDWAPDIVVTVCDKAAGETCPVWFGNAIKVHWGLEDPSAIDDEKLAKAAFRATIGILAARIHALLEAKPGELSDEALAATLNELSGVE